MKHGVLNLILTIPIWILILFWMWIIGIGLCIGILGLDTIPYMVLIIGLLPLVSVPISCIYGIIRGYLHRKEKSAIVCIFLSFVGLLIFAATLYGIFYLGSRF